MADYLIKGETLSDIADAIRAKKNTDKSMTAGEFAAEIEGITGGGLSKKAVNFYDFDGTILYSYTAEEAQALTALPTLPSHEGLICQGWNLTLDDIKAYVGSYGARDVGAMYITDDGKTRLYIRIAAEGRMSVPLYFSQTVANGVRINWGDGSSTQTLSGTGSRSTTHTYASVGDYVISLEVTSGTLNLASPAVIGGSNSSTRVYNNMLHRVEIGSRVTSIGNHAFSYCYSLSSITIPNGITSIGNSAFNYCCSLSSIVIPDSVTSIGTYAFNYCGSLSSITIPNGAISIGTYAFYYCLSLSSITIPDSVTSIGTYAFSYCYSLSSIIIPNSVTSIGNYAFNNCQAFSSITIPNGVTSIGSSVFQSCYGTAIYDFSSHTSVPTLSNTTSFSGIHSSCKIRVPSALYDEWIAATNWASYASQIVAV